MKRHSAALVALLLLAACQPSPTSGPPESGNPAATGGPAASISNLAWQPIALPDIGPTTNISAALADGGGFTLVGGVNDQPARWFSSDGRNWSAEPLPGKPGITPTGGAVTPLGTVLVGGGSSDHCAHPAAISIWMRPTGAEWEAAPFDQLFCADPYVAEVVSNGRSLLLAGTGFGEVGLAWRSTDGRTWAEATPQGMRQTYPRAAAWTGKEYIVLAMGEPTAVEWSSTDAVSWARTDIGLPLTNSASVATIGDTVLAVVRDDNDATTTWERAADGEWSPLSIPGIDDTFQLATVAANGDRAVFLGTHEGNPALITWAPGEPTASAVAGPDQAIDLVDFAISNGTLVVLGGVGTINERQPAAWVASESLLP